MTNTSGNGDGLYTLEEARREMARRECAGFGHDLDIVYQGAEPVRLVCGRGCGHRGWTITPTMCAGHDRQPLANGGG